ncbi:Ankyrin-2 [Colletotrichum sp. SAR 10_99]|nr:Ankyrin-2 [Colletotrichum sp. SAR 10_99]
MWISDPEFLGNFSNSARVWSYGYNSDPSVNMTPSSIAFHANELLAIIMAGYTVNGGGGPTIFIAHGLGGVIVKKAVILSLSCPEYFNIRDSISGIVFLDTVHHGTDSEGVLKAVKTIAALSLQKGSLKPSWDDTRQYADAVREVNTAFLDRLPTELEILNFIAVVPKRRAELESSQSKTFTIDCDHFQLTRFPSPEDRIYLQLAEQVGELMTKASADTSRRVFFPPAPPVLRSSPVPRPPSPDPDIPVRPRPPPGRAMGLPPGVIPAAHGGNAHQAWLKKKSIEYMKERRDRLIDRLGTWNDAHLGHDINPMPGTCTWIETHPFFLEWSKSNATEDFYVYGSAGCGKTYLAKSVANHLSRNASKPWDLVFSFFCNASSTGNKKPPIMEYFIREILRERPQWFELLSSQFLFPDADGKFSMAALFGILRNIMSQLQLGQGPGKSITVYLIVDGLHECDVGFVKEFLALVASLIDHPVARSTPPTPPSTAPPGPFNQLFPRDTVRFKFFTTYTPNEVMAMASVRATRIKMKDQDIRKDIATYVDKRVEDFSTIKSTKDPPAELADSIKEQAESFFVYANCSMEDGFSTARDDDEYGFSMSRRIFPYPQKLGNYFDYNLLPLFQNISNDNYALSALHVILGTIGHIRGNTLRNALACLHDNPRLKFIDIQTILMHQCPRLIRVSDEFEAFPLHPSLRIHFNSYIGKDEQHANMASLCLKERHDEMIVDEAGLSPLMHAAKEPVGLPDMIRHFLQRPFDINRRDYAIGATALMFFCRFNTDSDQDLISEMIDAFMKAGADVNMSTFRGETPLWLACSNGNPILVGELLRVGANPNISDKDGSTPIHQAFSKPTKYSYQIIDKLSRAGADLNIKFPVPDKLIPMTAAIVDMHFDIFLHLLDNIDDINQRDDAGFAAIHLLMQPKYADWLPHLLERRDLDIDLLTDSESSNGAPVRLTALSYAITEQNFQAVELLLRTGANPDRHPQASDKSPLFVAVDFIAGRLEDIGDKDPNGNLDIAELLISYNSSINTIYPKSKRHTRSPLMLAVKNQNYPMVELLLKHGADPTLEEAYNLPGVLDAAVYGGNVEILKLLLEHSLPPSINYVPKDFDHILIEAAEKDVELVKLLLDHGADTKRFLAPGDPRTPLQAAVQEGNLGLCKLFLEYEPELVNYQAKEGLVCETPLNIAAREGHLEIVRCLLEAGAKPNFQSFYYQETPLWSACSRGKFEIAKLLYERAPETINTPSYDGETPLMGACSSGAIKLVAFLLNNGADLTPRCSNCGSCVWKALTNNSDAPAYKMIELLIKHGLGVDDVVSSVGFTVLGEACRSGDLPAVRYLLDLGADPVKGQLCPGKEPSDNSWRSAAQVAVDNREPGILDALLQHPKVADFIANADVYGETAVANADGFIAQYVAQLVKAQHRTIDDHFYIIRMLSRLLLLRTGYDDEAVRLIQAYVVDPWVREKDDRVEEAVSCEYYCDECGKDAEEETLYFCRFCVWTTGRCCFNNYKGMHEPIEVPLVMERRIMDINSEEFMGVLRILEQDFVTNKAPHVAEPAQKELFEADPESEDTTLSLAFLHSLGYLAFRRRAWNPYLPLAPKIYKRIEPWESFMRQERKEFQEWVYRTETAPWRLKNELEYFLESGRRTAYKDVGTTIAEEIMRDVGVLFHEPRGSRSPRTLRPNERRERGPRMLSDEESD